MKSSLLFSVLLLTAGSLFAQVTHVVQEVGFAYSPATVTINVGDSVKFEGTASHPLRQVSEETWDNNGTTLIQGGFSFASGSGTVGFPDAGTFYYVCTAHVASQGMKGKIIVQAATAVNAVSEGNFSIYPVPFTGNELTIELGHPLQNTDIQVFDLSGSLRIAVQKELISNTLKLDCSGLPAGVYILRIQSGNENLQKKFVKL
jgi:plastocyanin